MKIGVLSDTHLKSPTLMLSRILDELFNDVDLILHAGDITSYKVLDYLETRNVLAVSGNVDDYQVLERIPQTRIIPVEGKKLCLMHGWGAREGLPERVRMNFAAENPDLIVFGHAHIPFWGRIKGTLMFNPGSAGGNRDSSGKTVGILSIVEEKIEARFLSVET